MSMLCADFLTFSLKLSGITGKSSANLTVIEVLFVCVCVHYQFIVLSLFMEMLLFVVTISVGTLYGNDILTLIFSVTIIS